MMIVIFISMMMIISRQVLLYFYYESQFYWDTRWSWLSDGWITAGLCPNHPWVLLYLGCKSLFYVCFRNCYCMRRHGKAYEYNNDVRYVWYEQQQQRQYREFCSFQKSPRDILSLNHNDCSFVSTKRFPAHCRRPGSDSSRRSYWPSVFLMSHW